MIDVSWSFYGVFLQIGLEESKSSVRAPRTRSGRKKPTVCLPYNEFVLPTGLKKCRRAVKNLLTTPSSL